MNFSYESPGRPSGGPALGADSRSIGLLDGAVLRAHAQQNRIHTAVLLIGMSVLVGLPVLLIWGVMGLIVVAGVSCVLFFAARQTPPDLVMRAYRSTHVTDQPGAQQLVGIVHALSQRAGLKHPPSLYIIPSLTLNAFATGSRDKAAVAVTEGLLRKLSMKELAAVLAHEISHIKNGDLSVMAIADIASRIVQAMSYCALLFVLLNLAGLMIDGETKVSWLAILILYFAPLLSSLMQLGLSRAREYDADLEAAQLTGNPAWLVSALQRLDRHAGAMWEDLMMPVPGRRVPQPSVFRSHPTTESRVARLEALQPRSPFPPILIREEPFLSVIGAGLIAMQPRHRFPGVWY